MGFKLILFKVHSYILTKTHIYLFYSALVETTTVEVVKTSPIASTTPQPTESEITEAVQPTTTVVETTTKGGWGCKTLSK